MNVRTLVALLAASLFVGNALGQPAGAWPMFRGDGAHRGRAVQAGPELPSIQWRHPLRSGSYSSPAVGPEDRLYVGASDALYSISADGRLRWEASLDDFSITTPAVATDAVYSASTSGHLYAFSLTNGSLLWSFATSADIWSSPTIARDGTIYIGSSDGTLYAIDSRSGEARWQFAMSSDVFSSPAIRDDGVICAISQDGEGVLLDSADGSIISSFSLGTEVVSSPAFGPNGHLMVGSTDGTLFGLDGETGQIHWTTQVGGQVVSSPSIAADGTAFVGSSEGMLFAVDLSSGTIRWSSQLEGDIYSSPLLDSENRLYLGTVGADRLLGTLYGIDAATGVVLWTVTTDTPIWSSPAINAVGTLFVSAAGTETHRAELLAIERSDLYVDSAEDPVAGTNYSIAIRTSETFSPSSGTLFYRRGGERAFESVSVDDSPEGSGFLAVVPGSSVTGRGLEYYVSLSNGDDVRTYPATQAAADPLIQRVRVPEIELPFPLSPRQFRMVSAPLEVESPAAADVLTDDYGPYNTSIWRLFQWDGDAYKEFPDLGADFSPGTAFFLAHHTGRPFTVGGRTVDTSTPITITLRPGWNQVAVPFAFPVDWDDVDVVDPAQDNAVREIAFFDGTEMLQDVAAFNPLQPWTGYFVRNASAEPVEIAFSNTEADLGSTESDIAGAAKNSSSSAQSAEYVIRLSAFSLSDERRDTQNWIGFRAGATSGDDQFDIREAPSFGDHVRLSVMESDIRYAGNFKPADGGGAAWNLELSLHSSSPKSQWIEVDLDDHGIRPAGFQTHVIDQDNNRTVALIENQFRVDVGPDDVRHLTVVIGPSDYAADYLDDVRPHATAFFLDTSYPNPFSASTSIPYGLEASAEVTLEIFDVLGRRVAFVVDGQQEAGRHEAEWSGRNGAGKDMASGVYFIRLRADGFSTTRQVVLSR